MLPFQRPKFTSPAPTTGPSLTTTWRKSLSPSPRAPTTKNNPENNDSRRSSTTSWMTSLNHSQNQFRLGGRGHHKKW